MDKRTQKFCFFSRLAVIASVIFSLSVILGVLSFSIARDILALGKSENKVAKITINEISDLAGALDDNGIVDYPLLFSAYATLFSDKEIKNPTATVSANMDYSQLIGAFVSAPPSEIITISFPNGATTDQIIDIFVSNGIGSREGFEKTIESYPFEYDFITHLDQNKSEYRLNRLDGYLYPDIYEFYTGRSEAYYIYKMLDRFVSVTSQIGVDVSDDTLIMASMIQMSAKNPGQYEYLSSIFHKRHGSLFECPAASAYALGKCGIYIGTPTEEIISADTPYNTFKSLGLPPGAICNPSKPAIMAALYPAECNYKYYLTLPSGEVMFAVTKSEHEANCKNYANGS